MYALAVHVNAFVSSIHFLLSVFFRVKSILKGVKFPVNRKVFRWFIVLLISFVFVLICYFIITNIQSEEDVINDAITIEGKISDVVVHGERATLYLNIDDKKEIKKKLHYFM